MRSAWGHVEGHVEGHGEGHGEGHSEGHSEGHGEGHGERHVRDHITGFSIVNTVNLALAKYYCSRMDILYSGM